MCPEIAFCTLSNCTNSFKLRKGKCFCSARCRAASAYAPTKAANAASKLKEQNEKFKATNRDRSISFDGRYSGHASAASISR